MILGMYSVYDRKGALYNQPFFAPNDVQACRTIYMREKIDRGQLSEFPEDFLIVKVGSFDFNTGHVDNLDHKYEIIQEVSTVLKPREE